MLELIRNIIIQGDSYSFVHILTSASGRFRSQKALDNKTIVAIEKILVDIIKVALVLF
jgi:hypothetical protein